MQTSILNKAEVAKCETWQEYCKASKAYVNSVRTGTQNSEIYATYLKAERNFTAAFNKLEKLRIKNRQRGN